MYCFMFLLGYLASQSYGTKVGEVEPFLKISISDFLLPLDYLQGSLPIKS